MNNVFDYTDEGFVMKHKPMSDQNFFDHCIIAVAGGYAADPNAGFTEAAAQNIVDFAQMVTNKRNALMESE